LRVLLNFARPAIVSVSCPPSKSARTVRRLEDQVIVLVGGNARIALHALHQGLAQLRQEGLEEGLIEPVDVGERLEGHRPRTPWLIDLPSDGPAS
jgi:hypothetical protein